MGAFDNLNDDDPRVVAHESGKTHYDCVSQKRYNSLQAQLVKTKDILIAVYELGRKNTSNPKYASIYEEIRAVLAEGEKK